MCKRCLFCAKVFHPSLKHSRPQRARLLFAQTSTDHCYEQQSVAVDTIWRLWRTTSNHISPQKESPVKLPTTTHSQQEPPTITERGEWRKILSTNPGNNGRCVGVCESGSTSSEKGKVMITSHTKEQLLLTSSQATVFTGMNNQGGRVNRPASDHR
ncbi:Hypothetical predicted protein [Scomber scombrus]|uniref:Uncharacterized protein n=1 Tax=Scomber scombrus TaxID=13677 RepID=A0AAV1PJX4_SCOSC